MPATTITAILFWLHALLFAAAAEKFDVSITQSADMYTRSKVSNMVAFTIVKQGVKCVCIQPFLSCVIEAVDLSQHDSHTEWPTIVYCLDKCIVIIEHTVVMC